MAVYLYPNYKVTLKERLIFLIQCEINPMPAITGDPG